MRKVICQACGQPFYTSAPRVKYCCAECRNYGRQVKLVKWKEANQNYYERLKQRRQNDEAEAES